MCVLLKTVSVLFICLNAWAQVWVPGEDFPSEVVQHSAITIGYSEQHEVPRWVGHVLRREHMRDCFDRADSFRIDPAVITGTARPTDYRQSGFDRGHLAPAGDMKWSKLAMEESFFMSNITPQAPQMNRHRWSQLETLVRAWAKKADETIVISGPILTDDLPKLPGNNVSIPREHFKVLLRIANGKKSAIGFLMTQNPGNLKLTTFAFPVRVIEEKTGLNFFPHLSAAEQDELEHEIQFSEWDFEAKFSYAPCL